MDITWHGDTCFTLKHKGTKLVINPNGKLKGNLVLSSLKETPDVEGAEKVFDWPGEYEVKGVPVIAYQAWTKSKAKEEEEGTGERTIIFYFQIGGIHCCHLGSLGHAIPSEIEKQLSNVDILMINAGKSSNLDSKKISEILETVDPRVVIPMGEGNLKEALKDLGADNIAPQEKFSIKSRKELPEDKRLYVVLKKS